MFGEIISLVLLGLIFASCGNDVRPRPTLGEFKACQEQYCRQVLRHLHEPIEWHVVVDLSRSYASTENGERTLKKVRSILLQLPIAENDSICIDTFDVGFYPGFCSDPIREIDWPFMTSSDSHQMMQLEALLSAANVHREWTDILATVKSLPSAKSDARAYFVILTDGRHEPPDHRSRRPLFVDSDSEMVQVLTRFASLECADLGANGHLHRGLLILIDGIPAERVDWSRGRALIEEKTALPEVDVAALPQIAFWTFPEHQPPPIEPILRQQVERHYGIYSCLPRPGESARGDLLAEIDECSFWPGNGGLIELSPTSTMTIDHAEVSLPIEFLTLGPLSRTLTVGFESDLGKVPRIERHEITPSSNSSLPNWALTEVAVPITLSDGAVNGHRLPVTASFRMEDDSSRSPFLRLRLAAVNQLWGWSVLAERPGYLLLALALALWLLSLLLIAVKPPKLQLTAGGESRDYPIEPLRSKGVRFEFRIERTRIQMADAQARPPVAPPIEENHFVLDVFHLGFLPYFILWRGLNAPDPKFLPMSSGEVREFCGRGQARGQVITPWRNWRLNWRSLRTTQVKHEWPEPLKIKDSRSVDDILLEPILLERRRSFLRRTISILGFHTLAMSCVLAAVYQLFRLMGPMPKAQACILALRLWPLIVFFVCLAWLLGRANGKIASLAYLFRYFYSSMFWSAMLGGWLLLLFPGEFAALFAATVIGVACFLVPLFLPYWVEMRIQEERSFDTFQVVLDTVPIIAPMVGQS